MSALENYRPQSCDAEAWERVRTVVEQLIDKAPEYQWRGLRIPASRLALHADRAGHQVTLELLTADEFIEQFCSSFPGKATAATYRSKLRSLANLHRPERAALSKPIRARANRVIPYSPDEVERMLAHGRARRTPHQRLRSLGFVLAAVGAGLDGRDLIDLTGAAVRREGASVLVDVSGSRQPRTVVVLPQYADELEQVAAEVCAIDPHLRLVGGAGGRNATDMVGKDFRNYGGPKPAPRRLRSTYITDLVERRLPLPLVTHQAGLQSIKALEPYLLAAMEQLMDDAAIELAKELLQ